EIGLAPSLLLDGQLFRGTGCPLCFGTGYKGRRGIYELMVHTDEVKQQLLKSPDAVAIEQVASRGGMLSLKQDGALLVRDGVTTAQELLRVARDSCKS